MQPSLTQKYYEKSPKVRPVGGECCSGSSHFFCSSALLFLLLGTAKEVWKQIKNQSYAGGEKSQTAANRKQNICLLSSSSPHLKSHLTSKGEKNPFAESLGSEESTSSAGCWLSSQRWLIFLLCHPPQRSGGACD